MWLEDDYDAYTSPVDFFVLRNVKKPAIDYIQFSADQWSLCPLPGIGRHGCKKRLTGRVVTFALGGRGEKRLGGNYLVNPGILSVINGPIWHLVRDHLKSSTAVCRTCQSAIINIGGFRVTLSPRFKCDTSKHISTLCNAGHGASGRSVRICQWNKCVRVESRQQRSFQWSILNQQTQLRGRS